MKSKVLLILMFSIILAVAVSGCTSPLANGGTGNGGADGGFVPVCGNGDCETGETAANCPADCAAPLGAPEPSQWQGWSKQTSAHGFSAYTPQDWSIDVHDSGLIRIGENPASGTGSMVFIWTIALNEQTTEESLFGEVVSILQSIMPGLQATGGRYVSEYDAYAGAVEYGSYEGVLIVSIDGMNAFLSGIIAPKLQYEQSLDSLIRVLYSFKYEPGLMEPDAVGITQMVEWTDPIEGAFSLNVPEGWVMHQDEENRNTANYMGSGLSRPYIDAGYVINVYSDDAGMGVYAANPYGYIYVVPTPALEWSGFTEGTAYNPTAGMFEDMIVWHYVDAREYLSEFIEPVFEDAGCVAQGITDRPELVESYQELPWVTEVTAAEESFGCSGTVETVIVIDTYYEMWGIGLWVVSLSDYWAPEGKTGLVEKIYNEMQGSFRLDPEWAAEEQRQVAIRTGIISETGSDIADMISSAFQSQSSTMDETAHEFSNAILGLEDVYDPGTGEQWSVPSGSSHYWRDIYGNVWGTGTYTPPTYSDDWQELYCPHC